MPSIPATVSGASIYNLKVCPSHCKSSHRMADQASNLWARALCFSTGLCLSLMGIRFYLSSVPYDDEEIPDAFNREIQTLKPKPEDCKFTAVNEANAPPRYNAG